MERYNFISYERQTYQSKQYRALGWSNQEFYIGLSKTSPWQDTTNSYISDSTPPKPWDVNELSEMIIMKKVQEVKLAKESACGDVMIMDKRWSIYDPSLVKIERGGLIPDISHVYFKVLFKPTDLNVESIRVISLHSHIQVQSNYQEDLIPASLIIDQGIIHWVSFSTPIQRKDITGVYSEVRILLEV